MSKTQTKKCPAAYRIEAFVANRIPSNERNIVLRHIASCRKCQAIAAELQQFYHILNQEERKPVASAAFKIVYQVEGKKISLAGILLHTINQHLHMPYHIYRSEIVFSTSHATDSFDLEDLESIPIDDDEIFIRAIQELANHETILFFFAHHEKLYRNIQFQIQSIDKQFATDDIGMAKIGCIDLAELDNQEIKIFSRT